MGRITLKRIVPVLVAVAIALALGAGATNAIAAAKPKPGATCSSVGKKVTAANLTYTCIKQGKKKVWSKGKKAAAGQTASPTPTPTATPTPTPSVEPSVPPTDNGFNPNPAPRNPKIYPTAQQPLAMASGTVIKRIINTDATVPAITLSYVSKLQDLGNLETAVDQYSEPGGTYLANINMSVWITDPKDLEYKYAWAATYSKSTFDGGELPFPSANRFKFYDIRMFKDEAVLYYFFKPVDMAIFDFCKGNPTADFAGYTGPTFLPWVQAGIKTCDKVPSRTVYMDQFALDRVPLDTYDTKTSEGVTKRSKDYAAAIERLGKAAIANAKARNVGLQYTGHGAGVGGLLESQVFSSDALPVLRALVTANGGKKLAYFDASTNCDESSVTTLDDFTPYVDYVIASEFERGGYAPVCNSSGSECYKDLSVFWAHQTAVRPYFFASNLSIEQSLDLVMLYYRHSWYGDRETVIPQSLTLVDSNKYVQGMKIIKQEIAANRGNIKSSAAYAITSPSDAPGNSTHRDIGLILNDVSPLARNLFDQFVLSIVSTENVKGETWNTSGVYIYDALLKYWLR